ncbi:cytochrome c oxidase subunit 2 [Halogranum rubrum]|uniref:Cytochrome c oxidase subunit 2 n=1 Tax=Halogranum rubrum TaxID=553466 RepID=A0A1I4CAL3_9EURY|nr:cytochrome c oxidase subunit II [Halogranum rubrum]SFK78194.1 cytochrome c oxidase subunit 2 [Halogranum rubrum]
MGVVTGVETAGVPLHSQGLLPSGSRIAVFSEIFTVFLVLGTFVGVLVIGYMLYNAYRYRDGDHRTDDADRPVLGELPGDSGGGRKLLFSFSLSAIVVVSLIVWTYGALLDVESVSAQSADADNGVDVRVEGYQFGWRFVYLNGYQSNELRVPADTTVRLSVTSDDVFHNFGIPALRVKMDAIPGQTTETWFVADDPGTYQANCYELCGAGHSFMNAPVVVMEPDEYDAWYGSTTAANESSSANESSDDAEATTA